MDVEFRSQPSQITHTSSESYITIRFDQFPTSDISTAVLMHQIINYTLNDLFGKVGALQYGFTIVGFKECYAILKVNTDIVDSFVGALAMLGDWKGQPCRIATLGVYSTLFSASHQLSALLTQV